VIDVADPGCHLDWTLLAAIGQVESDHGQVGGSHLDRNGVAHPPIYGPLLDGRNGVAMISDTDAGRIDGSRTFDRAVGPMQFLPSTWAAVAVDGNGDGQRNVQDINDAALGAAVYLCAGQGDLSTHAGRAAAVFSYNHSQAYVALVLGISRGLQGQAVFTGTTGNVQTRLLNTGDHRQGGTRSHRRRTTPGSTTHHHGIGDPGTPSSPAPSTEPTSSPTDTPTSTPTSTPTDTPTSTPTDTPTGTPTSTPTDTPTSTPTSTPTDTPTDTPTSTPTDTPSGTPSASPTGSPTDAPSPVIPDPVPHALADFTRREVKAYDAAWPVCQQRLVLDPASANRPVRRCLARQLGVPRRDPHLLAFVAWVVRHEEQGSS
jgi:hypothetical protein